MRLLLLFFVFIPTLSATGTVICTNGFTLINNKCLRLFTEPTTRRNASKICGNYGGTLVTIKNAKDNKDVARIVGKTSKRVWLGLFCFENLVRKCIWDSNGSAEIYDNFATNFPMVEIDHCVIFKATGDFAGRWLSADCNEDYRAFVCEAPTTFEDECALNFNGHCYFPSESPSVGFDNARNSCQNICADLVSFHSTEEVRFVMNYYEETNVSSIFIGARAWPSQYFNWVDGSSWYSGHFDTKNKNGGSCLMMMIKSTEKFSTSLHYGTDCLDTKNFMCKRRIGVQCNEIAEPTPTTIIPLESQDFYSFRMAPGSFFSPNYPGNYTTNVTSVYSLATIGSERLRLKFQEIDVEPNYDRILIYDGDSEESPLIGNLTGTYENVNYESSSNMLHVVFTSDGSRNHLGFLANFVSIF